MRASLVDRSCGARGLAPATPGARPVVGGGDLLFRHPARAVPRAHAASSSFSSSPARLSSLIVARGGVAQAAAAASAPLSRRRRWRASAAPRPQQQQPLAQQGDGSDDLAAVEQAVERAAATLDELLQQVLGECVAEQAASFLRAGGSGDGATNAATTNDDGWPSADTLEGIVRGAVAQRVEWLDDAFLAALDAFVVAIDGRRRQREQQQQTGAAAADADADGRLIQVLQLVRGQVLAQVSARLPPAVRVLDAALRETERRERIEVVERALLQGGGGGDDDISSNNNSGGLPRVSFEALASAAGQLVDDMEDAEAVPDRALLARLVLLREELRAMHARQAWGGGGGGEGGNGGGKSSTAAIFGFNRANLPRSCAAFAKELLAVGDGTRRAALLTKAFEEDWTGGAGGGGGGGGEGGSGGGGFGGASQQQKKKQKKESPDVVRPGRFLATLHAMSAELEQRVRSSQGDSGEAREEAERAVAVLRRMDDVRMEAVAVLDRMQRGGRGVASR
jgi:hypothetical protein